MAYGGSQAFREVPSGGVFADGQTVRDAYAGDTCRVEEGRIACPTDRTLALFEQ